MLLIMNTATRVLTSHHNHMEEQSDELSRTSPNTELARILGNSIQPWGLEVGYFENKIFVLTSR